MGLLGILRGAVNFGGKVLRGAAKGVSISVQLPGKTAGAVVRTGAKLAGGAVGLISKRLGGTIRDVGEFAAGAVETPGKAVGLIIEQTTNKGTELVSHLTGDWEGEIDACLARDDWAWNDFTEHWEAIWETAQKAAEGFTGETCYKLAKKHLTELRKEQSRRQAEVNSQLKEQSKIIQKQLSCINSSRMKANVLFRKFEQLSSAFSVWKIRNQVFTECFSLKKFSFTKLKEDKDFFSKVDFDNHPIRTKLEGWLSAGISIEIHVKEVEEMIKASKIAFEDEYRTAQEEVKRYKKVAESLTFVEENFMFFTDFYRSLLNELGYSIDLLREAGYMRNMFFFANSGEKLNPAFLPNRHIRCLQACDKLSRLLCDLAKRKYFNDSNVEIIELDRKRVEKYRVRFVEPLKKQFAA